MVSWGPLKLSWQQWIFSEAWLNLGNKTIPTAVIFLHPHVERIHLPSLQGLLIVDR